MTIRKMRLRISVTAAALLALGAALAGSTPAAWAQASLATGSVSLDLSALQSSGTYFLDFQLLDGNGIGDGNALAAVTNLSLTGGTLFAPGTALIFGNVSGDPTAPGGLQLVDSDPSGVSEYTIGFIVGSSPALLSFDLNVSATAIDSPIADQFNFQILKSDMSALPTDGPAGTEFVSTALDSPAPGFGAFGSAPSSPVTIAAPNVVTAPPVGGSAAAPEPSTLALIGLAGLPLAAPIVRRRRI